MKPVTQTIVIDRPIEEVFDVATCQERCVVWRGPIIGTSKTSDGPVGKGSTYKHEVSFLGMTIEAEPVITVWDPPHRAEIKNRSGLIHYTSIFIFTPTEQGTEMTSYIEADTGGAFGLIPDALVHSALNRQHKADLESLKELMESETEIKA